MYLADMHDWINQFVWISDCFYYSIEKFEFGLIRNHYVGRTFIEPTNNINGTPDFHVSYIYFVFCAACIAFCPSTSS